LRGPWKQLEGLRPSFGAICRGEKRWGKTNQWLGAWVVSGGTGADKGERGGEYHYWGRGANGRRGETHLVWLVKGTLFVNKNPSSGRKGAEILKVLEEATKVASQPDRKKKKRKNADQRRKKVLGEGHETWKPRIKPDKKRRKE